MKDDWFVRNWRDAIGHPWMPLPEPYKPPEPEWRHVQKHETIHADDEYAEGSQWLVVPREWEGNFAQAYNHVIRRRIDFDDIGESEHGKKYEQRTKG
jgi:hypothetical protein